MSSTIWSDCPTDGMTVSPPFCIHGGFLTDNRSLTLTCAILCAGRDPIMFQQQVEMGPARATAAAITPFCFRIAAILSCVASLTVSLSSGGREESSATVAEVTIAPMGGSDCQCPDDCPGAELGPTRTTG